MGSYTRAPHLFYHCYAGLPKLNETPQGYSETSGVRSGKSHYVHVVSASPSCGRIEYKLLTQLHRRATFNDSQTDKMRQGGAQMCQRLG